MIDVRQMMPSLFISKNHFSVCILDKRTHSFFPVALEQTDSVGDIHDKDEICASHGICSILYGGWKLSLCNKYSG